MNVSLYMDVHVPYAVTLGLRLIGVSVITAQEDDLLAEANYRLLNNIQFGGVIYGHQQRINIGTMVRDLELIAKIYDMEQMANRVEYIPL